MREFRDGKRRRPKVSKKPTPSPKPNHLPRRGPGNLYRVWLEYAEGDSITFRAVSREAAIDYAAHYWGLDTYGRDLLRGVIVE